MRLPFIPHLTHISNIDDQKILAMDYEKYETAMVSLKNDIYILTTYRAMLISIPEERWLFHSTQKLF